MSNSLTPSLESITPGPRQSNIELLRIFAMFLVLVVHASFMATGAPSSQDFNVNPLGSFTKTLLESFSIVCVDVFVLISGWFGIKTSVKGFCNFIFQCAYFLFGTYLIFIICGWTTISIKGIAACFSISNPNWFIISYAALYIISPVLNAFVEKTDKKTFKRVLIFFFIFQTIWGWSGAAKFIEQGYSTFSFIGLYLLSRYLHIYGLGKLTSFGGYTYIITSILNAFAFYFCCKYDVHLSIFSYVNPFIIIGSMGLIFFFSNLKVNYNKAINWIAKSAFAVFLLHTVPCIREELFIKYINEIYNRVSGFESLLYILIILIFIYMLAIIVDQPRKWLWNNIIAKKFS